MLNALYAQPFSSQTRAALLTGRYPMRYGLQTLSLLPSSQYGLPVGGAYFGAGAQGRAATARPSWATGCSVMPGRSTGRAKRGFDTFYGSLSGQVEPHAAQDGQGGLAPE